MRTFEDMRGKACQVRVRLDDGNGLYTAFEVTWTGLEIALLQRPTEDEALEAARDRLRTLGTHQRIV